ncbi:VOC family protein [Halomonas sp. HK25]|uniref:VOC family protein n=1 Tax=Halomonas sp. HK25 TaxID=3394321 RepID=UPI0039FC0BB6
MEQRISLITLGVGDLARARRFYEEGLGWEVGLAVEGEVVFFQLNGLILSLYSRAALARDAGVGGESGGFAGIALAHNVRSEPEVDLVLSETERAGGRIVKPASRAEWGGYSGYFADPDGHLWEVAYNPAFPIDAEGNTRLG